MAFSFGSTAPTFGQPTPAFGSTPSTQPAAFGFGGLSAPTTTSAQSFGFGGLAPTTTTTPSFGFASAAPSTGTAGFGSSFNFGQTPGFGATAATSTPGFGGFGATATTTSAPSFFSGFGTQAPASSAGTGFGGFGSFGAKTTGFNTFGFGSTSTTTTAGASFGGFGMGLQGLGQQQQQQQINPTQALYNALFSCSKFGDERDTLLARWNLVQASYGMGKGYYAQNMPPVEFTPENPFCRFKAVGYSYLPSTTNEEGLVALTVNKKDSDCRSQESQIISGLNAALGNKPNISVRIDGIKPIADTKCQVVIYVEEKGATGSVRRILANDLANYLLQANIRAQLGNIGVEAVVAKVAPSKDLLKEYLDTSPAGLDPRLWKQGQMDNPDSTKLIPVPMVGFAELQRRLRCQEQETKLHQARLDLIAEDIAELQRKHTQTLGKVTDYRRKQLEFAHHVLKVMVKLETTRKVGLTIQPEEEQLRMRLEALQSELNVPTQFKGRLNELLSQVRMQSQQLVARGGERYSVDPNVQRDIKQFLRAQQDGLRHLVDVVKDDLESLKIIDENLAKMRH